MTRTDDRAWLTRAACADYPPDWWFPEERTPDVAHMGLVRSVCVTCPVRRECLDYALVADHVGPRGSNALCSNRGQRNDHNEQTFLPVAYSITHESGQGADLRATEIDTATSLTCNAMERSTDRGVRIATPLAVRRLLPVECLRLQAFPDWWLDDLGLADSTKYRMVGNAVCVNVIEWIARRLIASHSR
jgi:hypothetical protein